MFKPIKFPFGPSASGAAGVRALDAVGGDWQRKQGPGTTSLLMGEFRRVVTDDAPQYFCRGETDTGFQTRFTQRYTLPFSKWRLDAALVPIGAAQYADRATEVTEIPGVTYTYETGSATFFARQVQQDVLAGDYRAPPRFLAGVTGGYTVIGSPSFGAFPIYYDGLTADTPARRRIVAPVSAPYGREDEAMRPLYDPAVLVTYAGSGGGAVVRIDPSLFTYPNVEFYEFMPFVSMKDYGVMLMAEMFFQARIVAPAETYEPHIWLAFFEDHDYVGGTSLLDVTADMLLDVPLPSVTYSVGPPEVYQYLPSSGADYNNTASALMAFVKTVALPNNTALFFFNVLVPNTPTPVPFLSAARVLRVSFSALGAVTVDLVRDERVTNSLAQTVQSVVHLGDGRVLAKVMIGPPLSAAFGARPLLFLKSDDGGTTWSTFTPTGFDADFTNRFFGDLTVHRPADATRAPDDQEATVLITSWNPADMTYRVYESKDSGATWARKGSIYKTATFRRIDSFFSDDGGGNFQTLVPGPSYSAPVDITLPDRYT